MKNFCGFYEEKLTQTLLQKRKFTFGMEMEAENFLIRVVSLTESKEILDLFMDSNGDISVQLTKIFTLIILDKELIKLDKLLR